MGRNWSDSGYDSLQDGYVGGRKVEVVGHEEGGVNHYAYECRNQREVEDAEAKAAKEAQEEYWNHRRAYQQAMANGQPYPTWFEYRPGQMDRKVSDVSAKSKSSISSIGRGIAKGVDKLRAKIHATTAPKTTASQPALVDKTSSAADVSKPLPAVPSGRAQAAVRSPAQVSAPRPIPPSGRVTDHRPVPSSAQVSARRPVNPHAHNHPTMDPARIREAQQVWHDQFWGRDRRFNP
jgi:hypothetical protein